MSSANQIPLPQLPSGQRGKVVEITGGQGVADKLTAQGIRPGQVITRGNAVFNRGPVVIKVNSSEVAIGYGMASKVIVEVIDG